MGVQTRLVEKVQGMMAERDIEVLAVTQPENLAYLSGGLEIGGVLVVEQEDWELYASGFFRYTVGDWADVELYDDREELERLLEGSSLTDGCHADASDAIEQYDLEESTVVKEARLIKEEFEIERLRRACEIGDRAFERVVDGFVPGMTEWDIVEVVDSVLRKEGAYNSFDTLAHVNTLEPHREPTDREASAGDLVLVDLGCVVGGYASDMTRMVPNDVSGERRELLADVGAIQQEALACVAAGVEIGALCDRVQECVEDQGYSLDKHYLHSLGHGVGVSVHEGPRLAAASERELQEGMVVTIEPGLYVPNIGGVRIEDMVVVRENGYERLTDATRSYER